MRRGVIVEEEDDDDVIMPSGGKEGDGGSDLHVTDLEAGEESKQGPWETRRMVFFKKAGQSRLFSGRVERESKPPTQLLKPDGYMALGVDAAAADRKDEEELPDGTVVVLSLPSDAADELSMKRNLRRRFYFLSLLSVALSAAFMQMALTAVPPQLSSLPQPASTTVGAPELGLQRTQGGAIIAQWLVHVVTAGAGAACVHYGSALGVTVYMIAALLSFFFAVAHTAFFLMGLRYLLDFYLLYLAASYRRLLMASWFSTAQHRRSM